jgi:hypothetical protein
MDRRVLLSLIPWVAYSLIAQHAGSNYVGLAAVVACFGSLALAIYGLRSGGITIIDGAGVVTFAVLAVVGFVSGPRVDQLLVDFGRGGAALVLAAVMCVSALTVPFTEQYARRTVDSQYWGSPEFRAVNKKISLLWAGVILVMAICHLVAGALAASAVLPGHRPGNFLLNWALPIVLIMWAVKKTREVASQEDISSTDAT